MTESEVLAIIAQDEGQQLEFKLERERPSEIAVVLQGFAHAEGGVLLIGVSDEGEVVGVSSPKIVADRVYQAAEMLDPSLIGYLGKVDIVSVQGKPIVVAKVPAVADQDFILTGSYYIRRGSRTVAMTREEVRERILQTGRVSTETTLVSDSQLNDIDTTVFNQYLQKRSPDLAGPDDLASLLRRENFLVNDGTNREVLTAAALLLFGKKPQDFNLLFEARLSAVRFIGTTPDRFLDQLDISGSLPQMLQEGLKFFQRNVRHPLIIDPERTGTPTAVAVDEYPTTAVREALVNALCHRDYRLRQRVFLRIFDDRVEIINPGGLYRTASLEQIKGLHLTRNPIIANGLQVMNWVERFGTGLFRMERTMQEAGLPIPTYKYDDNFFQVTLFGPTHATDNVANQNRALELSVVARQPIALVNALPVKTEQQDQQIPVGETAEDRELRWLIEKMGGARKLDIRINQARATLYARTHGGVTRTRYMELNNVNASTAKHQLHELLEEEIFELIGASRSAIYRLKDYKPRNSANN